MFARERDYSAFLQTVRIDVGTLVGLKADEDAYIVLKELPTLEMLRLKEATEKNEEETLRLFKELLPLIIVDHNFYEDDEMKMRMSNEAISALIFESITLTMKVVQDYTNAAFFTHPRKKD